MRTAFIETLCELAERDRRIWLLCGDLGYSVLEGFAERFPERYANVGIAEQNMMGMAAGLALTGKVVFTYSIANFPVMRCLEQVRNDVCYHNLNVKIVAVGGGLAYGTAGYTHHAVEDLAVMSAMPNMAVLAPADPVETRLATAAIAAYPGPCYLRLGKAGEPVLYDRQPEFSIGKAIRVRDGKDITLISTGGMLGSVIEAAERLQEGGCSAQVLSMPTLSPLDSEAILQAARTTGRIVTVEEHGIGGLGSAVADVLAQSRSAIGFVPMRLGRDAGLAAGVGSQTALRSRQGLSPADIAETATRLL